MPLPAHDPGSCTCSILWNTFPQLGVFFSFFSPSSKPAKNSLEDSMKGECLTSCLIFPTIYKLLESWHLSLSLPFFEPTTLVLLLHFLPYFSQSWSQTQFLKHQVQFADSTTLGSHAITIRKIYYFSHNSICLKALLSIQRNVKHLVHCLAQSKWSRSSWCYDYYYYYC